VQASELAHLKKQGGQTLEQLQNKIAAIQSGRITLPTAPGKRAEMLRSITKAYSDHLGEALQTANLSPHDWARAERAMTKLTSETGGILEPQENALLSSVFGNSFVKPLEATGPQGSIFRRVVREAAAIHRAFITSYDISAPFHAVHLTLGSLSNVADMKIVGGAFKDMLKFMASEKHYAQFMEDLAKRPGAQLARRSGLFLANYLTPNEEMYATRLLRAIPGVAPSERAFVGYLNKLRADLFDQHAQRIMDLGFTPKENPGAYRDLADAVNILSGRGNLHKLEPIGDLLGTIFFAPRYMAAQVQMMNPARYFRSYTGEANYAQHFMRQKMATSIAAGLSLSALSAAATGGRFETDPRSSDFMNVVKGPARWSFMGPAPGYFRTAFQILSKERKGTVSQTVRPLSASDRLKVAAKFAQNKLAPTPGIPAAMAFGDYKGEEFTVGQGPKLWGQILSGKRTVDDLTPEEKKGLRDLGSLAGYFVPMAPQAVYETTQAAEQGKLGPAETGGMVAALISAISILGARSTVYQDRKKGSSTAVAPVPPPQLSAPAP
jgi:hypothetical protein